MIKKETGKGKLKTSVFNLNKEQKNWLRKESKRWDESEATIIRSLINARINNDQNGK